VPSRFLADRAEPSGAFRLAVHLGSANVAELGTIWSSSRPGRQRPETLGLSLPRQSWTSSQD
jgi:hypothetical protein